jgi:hypothetical protein
MRTFFLLLSVIFFTQLSCNHTKRSEAELRTKKKGKHIPKKELVISKKRETKFECISDCDNKCNTSQLVKNNELPLDIVKQMQNDITTISFHFISDACQKYIEEISVIGDTVYLNYKSDSDVICECFHDYHYRFTLINYPNKILFLKDKSI